MNWLTSVQVGGLLACHTNTLFGLDVGSNWFTTYICNISRPRIRTPQTVLVLLADALVFADSTTGIEFSLVSPQEICRCWLESEQ